MRAPTAEHHSENALAWALYVSFVFSALQPRYKLPSVSSVDDATVAIMPVDVVTVTKLAGRFFEGVMACYST